MDLAKQGNQKKKKSGLKLWIGLIISALFLYFSFRGTDLGRTWKVIRSADLFFLLIIVLITFLQYLIRAWRWDIFLEPIKKTGFKNRLSAVLIGFAANCIFPARLGEFIRANYLGQREGVSGSSAFGTLVVERLFDGFTLLLVLLIGILGTTFPEEWSFISGKLRGVGFLLLGFYLLLIIFLMGFKYKAKPFLSLLEKILFFLPRQFRSKLIDIVWNFSEGLILIKKPRKWALAVFFSFFLWFTSLCTVEMTEQSIGISLPFIATFLIMAMASFGVMIPSAPGFVGTFHLAAQYGFIFYGLGKEEALSAAIIWHAAIVFPTILFGLTAFLILHVSPSGLSGSPPQPANDL